MLAYVFTRCGPSRWPILRNGWRTPNGCGVSNSAPSKSKWSAAGEFAHFRVDARSGNAGTRFRGVHARNRRLVAAELAVQVTRKSPGALAFEEGVGGRFTETLPGGEVFEIGRRTAWEPGARLAY